MEPKVVNYRDVEAEVGNEPGTRVRRLILQKDGAPNYSMILHEIEPGRNSPSHTHANEHEVFILEGECLVVVDGREYRADAGSAIFIPPNVPHQFKNVGSAPIRRLVINPHSAGLG